MTAAQFYRKNSGGSPAAMEAGASRARGGSGGFTLLELLVAMALAAAVLTSLFAMFRTVIDTAAGAKAVMGEDRAARTLMRILEDDLGSAAVSGRDEDEFTARPAEVNLAGTPFLVFSTTSTLAFTEDWPVFGVQRVEYVLRRGREGKTVRLVRRERPYAGVEGDFDWREYPLGESLAAFRAEYFDDEFNEFEKEWNPGSGENAPYAVRFTFRIRPEGREWELVVPVPGGGAQ